MTSTIVSISKPALREGRIIAADGAELAGNGPLRIVFDAGIIAMIERGRVEMHPCVDVQGVITVVPMASTDHSEHAFSFQLEMHHEGTRNIVVFPIAVSDLREIATRMLAEVVLLEFEQASQPST